MFKDILLRFSMASMISLGSQAVIADVVDGRTTTFNNQGNLMQGQDYARNLTNARQTGTAGNPQDIGITRYDAAPADAVMKTRDISKSKLATNEVFGNVDSNPPLTDTYDTNNPAIQRGSDLKDFCVRYSETALNNILKDESSPAADRDLAMQCITIRASASTQDQILNAALVDRDDPIALTVKNRSKTNVESGSDVMKQGNNASLGYSCEIADEEGNLPGEFRTEERMCNIYIKPINRQCVSINKPICTDTGGKGQITGLGNTELQTKITDFCNDKYPNSDCNMQCKDNWENSCTEKVGP